MTDILQLGAAAGELVRGAAPDFASPDQPYRFSVNGATGVLEVGVWEEIVINGDTHTSERMRCIGEWLGGLADACYIETSPQEVDLLRQLVTSRLYGRVR